MAGVLKKSGEPVERQLNNGVSIVPPVRVGNLSHNDPMQQRCDAAGLVWFSAQHKLSQTATACDTGSLRARSVPGGMALG